MTVKPNIENMTFPHSATAAIASVPSPPIQNKSIREKSVCAPMLTTTGQPRLQIEP